MLGSVLLVPNTYLFKEMKQFSACIGLGGLGEEWRIGLEGGRINFNRFSPDPTVRHSSVGSDHRAFYYNGETFHI